MTGAVCAAATMVVLYASRNSAPGVAFRSALLPTICSYRKQPRRCTRVIAVAMAA